MQYLTIIPWVHVGYQLAITQRRFGHGLKDIMVGHISESRMLIYHGHEINMTGF